LVLNAGPGTAPLPLIGELLVHSAPGGDLAAGIAPDTAVWLGLDLLALDPSRGLTSASWRVLRTSASSTGRAPWRSRTGAAPCMPPTGASRTRLGRSR